MATTLNEWARTIKRDVHALYLAARDPERRGAPRRLQCATPSPIDLIPDFIPVAGYLDEAILVPLGILAVVR